jgi:hypothetical protein
MAFFSRDSGPKATRRFLIVILVAFYPVVTFIGSHPFVVVLAGTVAALAVAASLPALAPGPRWISLLLFGVGSALLAWRGADTPIWVRGMTANLYLVAILVLVPLLTIPLKYGDYAKPLEQCLAGFIRSTSLYGALTIILSYAMGFVMNIGSVPVVYRIVLLPVGREYVRLLATAIARGVATIFLWSPNVSVIALLISHYQVSWIMLARPAAVLTLICLFLAFITVIWEISMWEYVKQSSASSAHRLTHNAFRKSASKLFELGTLLAGTITSILSLALLTKWHIIMVVCLVAILFPPLWMCLNRRLDRYLKGLVEYARDTLPHMASEVVIFTAAGFFGVALGFCGIQKHLTTIFSALSEKAPQVIPLVLSLIVVAAAVVGVHPVVSVTALALSIEPAQVGLSPTALVLILGGASGLGALASPFSALGLTMGSLVGISGWRVTLGWNWRYIALAVLLISGLTPHLA